MRIGYESEEVNRRNRNQSVQPESACVVSLETGILSEERLPENIWIRLGFVSVSLACSAGVFTGNAFYF